MNTEKLHKLITNTLAELFAESRDTLGFEIKTLPHNGAEVQLNYIFKDKTSKSGFSSVPCAEPIVVYGISGEENIRKKLKNALICG